MTPAVAQTRLAEQVCLAVARRERQIRDFTAALVAIPTENPPGRYYRDCAQLLVKKLRELRLPVELLRVPSGKRRGEQEPRYCVLASLGRGRRTLYFHGHYDVVPAQSPQQFHPIVQHGMLAGRGSADMKSGLAAMIYAMAVLQDVGCPLEGRVGLVLVPDEETGGACGSRYLLESGRLGKDGIGMLTPEPTSGVIWNACRGAISLRVTVRGKPAHVGLHFQGMNAYERALPIAQAFTDLERRVRARKTGFPIHPAAARSSVLLVGGQSGGGSNFNAVPAECWFTLDRRINPEEPLEGEKRALLRILERFRRRGTQCSVEVLQEEPAAGFSPDEPVARALAESARQVLGRTPRFEMCPGLLEIRFYAQRSVPAFAYGPGKLEVAHGPRECVTLQNVYAFTSIYALAAARVLAPGAGT